MRQQQLLLMHFISTKNSLVWVTNTTKTHNNEKGYSVQYLLGVQRVTMIVCVTLRNASHPQRYRCNFMCVCACCTKCANICALGLDCKYLYRLTEQRATRRRGRERGREMSQTQARSASSCTRA